MAVSLNAGSRKSGGHRRATMSEINVTPLVDVMLVLLVVFMVTAPLMTVGVPVDLPKTTAASLNDKIEPLTISLDGKGRIFIQETEITEDQLVPRLKAITASKPDTAIYVRGDKGMNYGRVMEVMGLVAAAGFQKVSLIAELPGTPATQQRRSNR